MLRIALCAAIMLTVPACSGNADEDSDGFRPPVVEARGDYMARQERRFARLDHNSDGVIASDELPGRRPERVSDLDGDRNGKVSKSEYVEGSLKRFDAMDANKDGDVTPEERTTARGN